MNTIRDFGTYDKQCDIAYTVVKPENLKIGEGKLFIEAIRTLKKLGAVVRIFDTHEQMDLAVANSKA